MPQADAVNLPTENAESGADQRRLYEDVLVRAMYVAERYLPRDEALEIAHTIATGVLHLSPERVSGAFIYVAVTRRLRSHWRRSARRASVESAYHEKWSAAEREWVDPGAALENRELHDSVLNALAEMPERMRAVFILIREEELSYREAAQRLGVKVGTIHTQISRANAFLRDRIAKYRAAASRANPETRDRAQ